MYSEEEDDVRPPDPIRLERLVDTPIFSNSINTEFHDFLDRIGGFDESVGGFDESVGGFDESVGGFDESVDNDILKMVLQETAKDHDEEIMNQIHELERKSHFAESKKVFMRLSHIDKQHADMYNQILSFITLYEDGYITRQPVSLDFNIFFFEILAKIRVPKEEIGRWTTFLYVE